MRKEGKVAKELTADKELSKFNIYFSSHTMKMPSFLLEAVAA